MVYVTGDCHAEWERFSTNSFPEQKDMTRDDFVIVCGDFGIWNDNRTERWWLNWFEKKNFTTLFIDGNHENFDRLYGSEFEIVKFHGGLAHKIRENVYHLMRGHVFELCGKKFFTFGGAATHDIQDGILYKEDYPSLKALVEDYNKRTKRGQMLRINGISWWKEEMPCENEMIFGINELKKHKSKVDYIITHCCPQEIVSIFSHGTYEPDKLTSYFNNIAENTKFSKWFFGHYHHDGQYLRKYIALYEQIIRVV